MDHAHALTRLRYGRDQFRDWQEDLCDRRWKVDTRKEPSAAPFRATLDIRRVGGARMNQLSLEGGGTVIGRSRRRVAADDGIGVALSVVERGHAQVTLGGSEHELTAGDVSMLSGHDVFEKRMPSPEYREHLVVVDERDVVKLMGGPIERRGPVVARRHGVASILGDLVRCLAAQGPVEGGEAVLKSVLVLVAEVFQGRRDVGLGDAGREWRRTRVHRTIDEHLADPELGPRLIAEKNRVSLRYLHKLFEGTGATVASTILERRLDRCRADLDAAALAHVRVSEIAFSWGFTSAAHFSRAFKARYGLSPVEARQSSTP